MLHIILLLLFSGCCVAKVKVDYTVHTREHFFFILLVASSIIAHSGTHHRTMHSLTTFPDTYFPTFLRITPRLRCRSCATIKIYIIILLHARIIHPVCISHTDLQPSCIILLCYYV